MPKHVRAHEAARAALIALPLCVAAMAETPALFELTAAQSATQNAKGLNMTLRETERAADYSLVEVTFTSGGSVSSSMFVLKGMCGVTRSRGEAFFAITEEGKSPRQYRIRFPRSPAPEQLSGRDNKIFALTDCALLNF